MVFSVVISVWKRPKELKLLLEALQKQARESGIFLQVIVSDSFVSNSVEYDCLDVVHIQTDNILAKKRNVGASFAKGDYIIFLDDDCIPAEGFLVDCLQQVKEISKSDRVVICGEIRFLDSQVNSSNYYKYRDSQHPKNINEKSELTAWSFVAMNYLICRERLIESNLQYGEDFVGYGAEDHDYGFKLIANGFKIIQGHQKIMHYEYGGDIGKYSVKIYHSSRDGMATLKKVNPDLYSETSLKIKIIEDFFFKKTILSDLVFILFFNLWMFKLVILFLQKIDGVSFLYLKGFYRYVVLQSYVRGVRDRNLAIENNILKNWYE